MTNEGTESNQGPAEEKEPARSQEPVKPGRTRLGGGCLLFFIIAALSGGAYFYYLYAREGSVSAAFHALRASSEDVALSAKVKAAFALSKRVSTFDIGVASRAGVVTLTGRVSSPQTRELAGEIASNITGVGAVRNDVTVDPSALPDPEIGRLSSRVVDLEIKAAVLEGFQRSPELRASGIAVQVADRTVRLSGTVSGEAPRRLAESTARGVEGVQGVKNEIVAAEPEALLPVPTDEDLARRVEGSLAQTNAFAAGAIEVLVNARRVTLKGSVRSVAEKLLAEAVAGQVEGVEGVGNELTLGPGQADRPS